MSEPTAKENQALEPNEKGLEAVLNKLDTIAQSVTENAQKTADALKAAQKAQEDAQKAADEAIKAKNTLPIDFTPAGTQAAAKSEKSSKNAELRTFLNDVKAAKFGNVKAALQIGAPSGSYLVPAGFVPELIDLLEKYPSYVSQARRLPWGVSGNSRVIPNLASRPAVAIVGEGEAKPISNPVFGQISQKLHKIVGAVVVTRELIEDEAIDLPTLLPEIIGPAFVDALNTWLFSGQGSTRPGIFTVSGTHTPTVSGIGDLLALKFAVPSFVRTSGKFYVANDVYAALASLTNSAAYKWLTYADGVMKIDGNDVVSLDKTVIGADGRVCFGDLKNVILSPKVPDGLSVRYSDTATMTEGSDDSAVTHNFFQENKEGWIFETRTELTVVGSVWSKGTITVTAG